MVQPLLQREALAQKRMALAAVPFLSGHISPVSRILFAPRKYVAGVHRMLSVNGRWPDAVTILSQGGVRVTVVQVVRSSRAYVVAHTGV